MCEVPVKLKELVKQILAAAAEEIFELLERTITENEEELMCFREKQEKSPEIDINRTVLYALVFPETPDPAQIANDAARLFFFKRLRNQSVRISSVLSFSAVDEQTDKQAEVPTFSLDSFKLEELMTILQTAPELLQADFNENGQEEDECENWEFEGLSGPESTERTENSSEEELLPPKKKPKLTDVSQNSNHVNSKPSKRTEAAERDGATVSYAASNEAVSSDEKTENSSDASENEDKSGKNSNQNCKENRGELPVNIIKLKDFKVVSNHMIRTLNFQIEKGHKIATASGNVGQQRKRKKRKKNTDKKAANDQSESDFGVKTSNHKCSECKATFDSLQKLKVHVNAHKRKKLSCSVCKKRFKHFLNRHMNVHKAQPATTAGKKNLDDTFNTKQTLASDKHDDETDTDKTKDSSDEN